MGSWEGLTPEEARAGWPEVHARVEGDPWREPPPRGESFEALVARVRPALHEIAGRHPGGSALVVTHGGILKALVCTLLEIDLCRRETLGMVNGAQVLVEVAGARWTLIEPRALAARQRRYDLDTEAAPAVSPNRARPP